MDEDGACNPNISKKIYKHKKARKRKHIMSTNKEQLQDIHSGNDWQVLGGFKKKFEYTTENLEYVHICASNGRETLLPM